MHGHLCRARRDRRGHVEAFLRYGVEIYGHCAGERLSRYFEEKGVRIEPDEMRQIGVREWIRVRDVPDKAPPSQRRCPIS